MEKWGIKTAVEKAMPELDKIYAVSLLTLSRNMAIQADINNGEVAIEPFYLLLGIASYLITSGFGKFGCLLKVGLTVGLTVTTYNQFESGNIEGVATFGNMLLGNVIGLMGDPVVRWLLRKGRFYSIEKPYK